MLSKKNIDDEQAETVEEHFQIIMNDESFVDSTYTKITSDDLPTWFDLHLFKKGQDYVHNNFLSLIMSYTIGLIAMLAIPSIAKVLMSTKKSSAPCLAYKRYFATETLIIDYHGEDVENSDSKFYKAINTTRYVHSMVCKRAKKDKQDGIKQKDVVIGLHGIMAYALLKYKFFSLTHTKEEREAFNHFWRVIGHLIGIPDRLNLCRKNEHETTLLCAKILNEYMLKHIKNASADFFYLTNAAVRGLQNVDPTLDIDAFLLFFHEINDIPYRENISYYSTVIYWYRKAVLKSFGLPIIGNISRIFWNNFLKFVLWLGINYPILAWSNFGKAESKLKLYPYSTI